MPSVEMRRSTRVFVPKAKDADLVKVLRSGRRLWVQSSEMKPRGDNKHGDECFSLINNKNFKQQNGWHKVEADQMHVDDEKSMPESAIRVLNLKLDSNSEDKMFKNVYTRKRKRLDTGNGNGNDKGDKKFGLHYVRKQRRKIGHCNLGLGVHQDQDSIDGSCDHGLLSIIVETSCVGCYRFSCLLSSLLRHMTKEKVELSELSEFLISAPISPAFASCGIHFFWNHPYIKSRGVCRIFGARQFIPLFTVDFSAAPLCFLNIHATMWFRAVRMSCLFSMDFNRRVESSDIDELLPNTNDLSGYSLDDSMDIKVVIPTSGVSKLGIRNTQHRLGVATRSCSKSRRRSLRTRRARNPSSFLLKKTTRVPVCLALTNNAPPLPLRPSQGLRRSVRRRSTTEISLPKSSSLDLTVDIDSQCCCGNILIVETDKCYRVEGAEIMLDLSDSNEWVLAIKKDGSTRYSLKAQREMRPHTTNRFTHSVIWAGENGWKLEFPERKEWLVFKELYKACGDRNVVPSSPVVKIIPVPGVCEVTNSWDSVVAPFERPDSYIRTSGDELSRALSSKLASYDMDSEDVEWLSMLNSDLDAENLVSEETFELMIDEFEKAYYNNPEDCNDEMTAAGFCLNLASRVVAEKVYGYWMKKRSQKGGPLIRVFQLNQPKRAQLIKRPVLRKKRSLKRQNILPIQRRRGKDNSVLQAIVAEKNAMEEQNAILRVEEATASASRLMETAISKRTRAQFLMENADLAMYRATMALRIAEAAQVSDSLQASTHFLD